MKFVSTGKVNYSHQMIYHIKGEVESERFSPQDYIKCAKCKEIISTREMWLDNDGKNKHRDCLSTERLEQIKQMIKEGL